MGFLLTLVFYNPKFVRYTKFLYYRDSFCYRNILQIQVLFRFTDRMQFRLFHYKQHLRMNMCFIVVVFPLGVIPSFYFKLSKRILSSEFCVFAIVSYHDAYPMCQNRRMMRVLIILTDVFKILTFVLNYLTHSTLTFSRLPSYSSHYSHP